MNSAPGASGSPATSEFAIIFAMSSERTYVFVDFNGGRMPLFFCENGKDYESEWMMVRHSHRGFVSVQAAIINGIPFMNVLSPTGIQPYTTGLPFEDGAKLRFALKENQEAFMVAWSGKKD